MKRLNPIFVKKIDVDQNSILSKRQLKYLIGGYGDPGYDDSGDSGYGNDKDKENECPDGRARFQCYCSGGSIGRWTACYYADELYFRINYWCASGLGGCDSI